MRSIVRIGLCLCLITVLWALNPAGATAQEITQCVTDASMGYGQIDETLRQQWRGGVTFVDVESGRLILASFEKGEDEFRPEHEAALGELIRRLTADDVVDYSIRAIVGGASQTGPEAENVELSRVRADRVAQHLTRAGIQIEDEYDYFGSSRPFLHLPDQECAVNRYVLLSYDLCKNTREVPRGRELLIEDVEEELAALQRLSEVPESERDLVPDMEMSLRRCDLKTRYMIGRSYEQLAETISEGATLPPPAKNTPAYFALGFASQDEGNRPRNECSGSAVEDTLAKSLLERSSRIWLSRAYRRALEESVDLIGGYLDTSRIALWHARRYRERLLAEHQQRCRQDIYFRYTYCGPEEYEGEDGSALYRWPDEWRDEADAIERRVFGDVTDCGPTEGLLDLLRRTR